MTIISIELFCDGIIHLSTAVSFSSTIAKRRSVLLSNLYKARQAFLKPLNTFERASLVGIVALKSYISSSLILPPKPV